MADFQQQVYIDTAMGRVGMVSRNDGTIARIPLVVEGDKVKAGSFGFRGTNPTLQVVGTKAGATAVDGLVIFSRLQANLTGANPLNTVLVNEGEEVDLITSGFAWVSPTNGGNFGDAVFANPTTGEIQTGSGSAPSGFIATGWVVETPASGDFVCEIRK